MKRLGQLPWEEKLGVTDSPLEGGQTLEQGPWWKFRGGQVQILLYKSDRGQLLWVGQRLPWETTRWHKGAEEGTHETWGGACCLSWNYRFLTPLMPPLWKRLSLDGTYLYIKSQNFCILKLEETAIQMSLIPAVTIYEIVFLQALKAYLSPQQEKNR